MDTYDTPIYDRQQEDDQLDHPSQTSAIRYEGDDCSRLQQRPLAASVYTEPAARGQLARYELPNLGRLEPNLYGRQDKQLDPFGKVKSVTHMSSAADSQTNPFIQNRVCRDSSCTLLLVLHCCLGHLLSTILAEAAPCMGLTNARSLLCLSRVSLLNLAVFA